MKAMIDNRCSVTTTQAWFVDMKTAAEEIRANQAIQLNAVTGVYSFNSAADAIAAEEELAVRRSRRAADAIAAAKEELAVRR